MSKRRLCCPAFFVLTIIFLCFQKAKCVPLDLSVSDRELNLKENYAELNDNNNSDAMFFRETHNGWTSRSPRCAAFFASFFMIVLSEPGDKTFFLTAVMSMKRNYRLVFLGATAALVCMTVLSVIVGATLPQLVDRVYTDYLAAFLFLVFGVRMIYEAWQTTPLTETSGDDVELSIKQLHDTLSDGEKQHTPSDVSQRRSLPPLLVRLGLNCYCSFVFIEAFYMVFLAEWGDRSQIATIALAASKDAIGAAVGASLGHCCCTAVAVLGGRLLASQINERIVSFFGGVTFLIFAGAYITTFLISA